MSQPDAPATQQRHYLSGFGNEFATEAIAGALPQSRNSPQRPAAARSGPRRGGWPSLLSGTAFTAPRHESRRSWLYRQLPSVVAGRYAAYAPPHWVTGIANLPSRQALSPEPLHWNPFAIPDAARGVVDFVDGLRTLAVNGDVEAQTGMAAHVYFANASMKQRVLINADGEMLIVPQQGRLVITTEMGVLDIAPGQIALLPRGMAFKVGLPDGPSRGYVCENYGAHFRLPELGPIGSNGLANARDFQAPIAAFDSAGGTYEIIKKYGGALWRSEQAHSPFNVVAWHGNLTPVRYDTAHFMTIGSISFDHPDPSIFTVLTSPSDTPGTANCDFVIFPPRWLVAEDTFRPPWYHRNAMSEFMGLVTGQYDAKPGGFKPGGASLHNAMVPHGPDAQAFEAASNAQLVPQKLDGTLAFMFESRLRLRPTAYALGCGELDAGYADCWAGLKNQFAQT